jgi:large subunit ribosomal protein L15
MNKKTKSKASQEQIAADSQCKNLGNLKPNPGSVKNKKRLGRGIGSGLGKTAGKGHKGMRARKSGGTPAGFEGGQTPVYRRLPKKGFTNLFRVEYAAVNLSRVEKAFEAGATVDTAALVAKGIVSKSTKKTKLLGSGLTKSLTLVVDKASKSAQESATKAGAKIEFIKGPKKFLRPRKGAPA